MIIFEEYWGETLLESSKYSLYSRPQGVKCSLDHQSNPLWKGGSQGV
jgi:hypothetical protein